MFERYRQKRDFADIIVKNDKLEKFIKENYSKDCSEYKLINNIKKIEGILENLVNDNDQLRKNLNTHLFPSFYGIRKALNPGFNGTAKLYESMENKRKNIVNTLIEMNIPWPKYEKYTIYMLQYIRNPIDIGNRPNYVRLFFFSLNQIELRTYKNWIYKNNFNIKYEVKKNRIQLEKKINSDILQKKNLYIKNKR